MIVRPTSEAIIADSFSKWVKSYRDLPVLVNQWANVVRWEMRPRLFLRTREFLWQEGHTAHATAKEAEEETTRMLEAYRELCEDTLAMPVICGRKPEHEKFPGAVDTYCVEAMMQDGKALQAGPRIFSDRILQNQQTFRSLTKIISRNMPILRPGGVSTRLTGGRHHDSCRRRRHVVPPKIAPYQIVIVPVIKNDADEDAVMEYIKGLQKELLQQAPFGEKIRIKIDKRDRKSVDKFWEWTRKGAPVILEIGPRDVAEDNVMVKERLRLGTPEGKAVVKRDEFVRTIAERLEKLQKEMFAKARARLEKNVRTDIKTKKELRNILQIQTFGLRKGKPEKWLLSAANGAAIRTPKSC